MPSDVDKAIYRTLAAAFGHVKPAAIEYWDNDHRSSVHVVSAEDSPTDGVTSYGTLGLSHHPLIVDGEELGVRMEVLGACASEEGAFGNVLATVAFNMINSGMMVVPGAIQPDVITMYEAGASMRHLLFLPNFEWDEKPETLRLPERTVTFLYALPIAESERVYAAEHGIDALAELFDVDDDQINVFDLDRSPVV